MEAGEPVLPGEEGYIEYDGEEVEYEDVEDDGELVEGVEEYDSQDDEEGEIEGEEADDEEDQPGASGGGAANGQGQMLYIPGLGYIPLSNLTGLGGAGGGGGNALVPAAAAPDPEAQRDWSALRELPGATQEGLLNALAAVKEDGRQELTLLVMGKGGVGKSSTINSLLNERVATVTAFQQDVVKPMVYSRRAAGFTLNCIDTPSILEQDIVSESRLEAIGKALRGRQVDVLLYLDRLDCYKVDSLDRKAVEGITRVLGPRIWDNAVLGLSRASESATPAGLSFEQHVEQRGEALRSAISRAGGNVEEMAVALIENSSRCPTNAEGEKVVPGDVAWIVELVEKVAEVAMNVEPFEYDPKAAARASNPNRRRKWLIPFVLAAQVALKLWLDRVMDEDGCRGDSNGPFDEQTVKERREELKREKEERERKKARKQQRAAMASQPISSAPYYDVPLSDEEDDDDF